MRLTLYSYNSADLRVPVLHWVCLVLRFVIGSRTMPPHARPPRPRKGRRRIGPEGRRSQNSRNPGSGEEETGGREDERIKRTDLTDLLTLVCPSADDCCRRLLSRENQTRRTPINQGVCLGQPCHPKDYIHILQQRTDCQIVLPGVPCNTHENPWCFPLAQDLLAIS